MVLIIREIWGNWNKEKYANSSSTPARCGNGFRGTARLGRLSTTPAVKAKRVVDAVRVAFDAVRKAVDYPGRKGKEGSRRG